MGYDDILPKIGGFGRHQWKLYFLFAFPVFINVFFKIGNVLIVAAPPYRFALNSLFLIDLQLCFFLGVDYRLSLQMLHMN